MSDPPDRLRIVAAEFALLAVCLLLICAIAGFYVFGPSGDGLVVGMTYGAACALTGAVPLALLAMSRLRELMRDNFDLATAASTDRLTRVMNRGAFLSKAQRELRRLRDGYAEHASYALLIVDADHFKRINDQLGHPAGDAALRAIAAIIRRSVRASDFVGRIGGEEFAVLLRGTDRTAALIVAERLRENVGTVQVGEGALSRRLSVSIGGIVFTAPEPYERLYEIADANLYRAKEGGRNRVELHALAELPGANARLGRLLPPPAARAR